MTPAFTWAMSQKSNPVLPIRYGGNYRSKNLGSSSVTHKGHSKIVNVWQLGGFTNKSRRCPYFSKIRIFLLAWSRKTNLASKYQKEGSAPQMSQMSPREDRGGPRLPQKLAS